MTKLIKKIKDFLNKIKEKNQPSEIPNFHTVTWKARYNEYPQDFNTQVRVFLDKQSAQNFVQSLKEAQQILQYTEDLDIKITSY